MLPPAALPPEEVPPIFPSQSAAEGKMGGADGERKKTLPGEAGPLFQSQSAFATAVDDNPVMRLKTFSETRRVSVCAFVAQEDVRFPHHYLFLKGPRPCVNANARDRRREKTPKRSPATLRVSSKPPKR
jgi:hypothetical protein